MFVFVVLGLIGAVIAAVGSRRKQASQTWAIAARELGITLKPTGGFGGLFGNLSMTGSVEGLDVTVDTHQSNDKIFTRYRVRYPSLDLGLSAKRQHALARIGRFFGYQDIEVGDPVFDESIVLKGDYPESVVRFLTPDRRVAITGLVENFSGAVITDTEIVYSKPGLVTLPSDLTSTMQRILSVAQQLRGVDHVTRDALNRRLAGDVAEALAMLEGAPATGDPFVDFARKQHIGEIRHARGDRAGAKAAFDDLENRVPRDPEVIGWARSGSTPERTAPAASEVGEATAVAEHLFHEDNYTFDTMEIFENEYEGRTVSWSGELKRLRRFDYDRDFGDGPGVKAVFAIASLGTDLYAGRDVDAIVRLAAETVDRLEPGKRYTFQGTLSHCDPAMRNLFVTGATLA